MSDEATTPDGIISKEQAQADLEDKGPEPKTYGEDYVKELRQQAAKYRTEKNSAVEEAKEKLTAEFQAALAAKDAELAEVKSSYSSKELETAKLRIAMRTLDQDTATRAEKLAELLKGEDEDSIAESAKSAHELFGGFKSTPVSATDPTQGRGAPVTPLNSDKLLNALKAVVGAP
jgi:wobble nucleotide-excising tRNase